ncbi:alpha/beta fold hydrolase [Brevibacterium album]|uniref:alpha/beta fold hydrolase n=1 Tax=Brevibacterium album TaxID=417948 RepID=UPI000401AE03|nr:alpha/beta fold hydrolase [Brevibacterium album]
MSPRIPGAPRTLRSSLPASGVPALPARLPHEACGELEGFDPAWSRLVTVETFDGPRTFHVLDTGPALAEAGLTPTGTILALHGNPTWSYLWRHLAQAAVEQAEADPEAAGARRIWRVIAPDQLDMGFSERLPHARAPRPADPGVRRIADRIADFDALVTTLLAEGAATASGAPASAGDGGSAASGTVSGSAAGDTAASGSTTGSTACEHPVVTIGHDWGGVLSLTWAARNQERVSAAVSLNTAVHQPEGAQLPAPLAAALAGPLLPASTVHTDLFLRTTLSLAKDALSEEAVAGFRAPYRTAAERGGIGGFVADIPATDAHPSHSELQQLGEDIAGFRRPALLVWGPKDPVFLERYLRDLRTRLPQADLHRFETASHLVSEQVDVAGLVLDWLEEQFPAAAAAAAPAPAYAVPASPEASTRTDHIHGPEAARTYVETASGGAESRTDRIRESGALEGGAASAQPLIFDALEERAHDRSLASVDMSQSPPATLTWAQVNARVQAIAAGLVRMGLRPGDRVSMLVPPGNDLTAGLYGVLRAGGVAVVADAGLGPAGMTRAVRSADPQWIIGERPGLTLARLAGWPGRRLSVSALSRAERKALGVEASLEELIDAPEATLPQRLPRPAPEADAAILFTSGSTGPAKGVRYTHERLSALTQALTRVLDVRPGSSLVAGFPPFALLGPGIGAISTTPDMAVTKPRTLTASALADAVEAGGATMVFASPAAYRNVVATAHELTLAQSTACARVRMVLSAGAPVPLELMNSLASVFPNARIHTPYGMTEGLILTDIERTEVARAQAESEQAVRGPEADARTEADELAEAAGSSAADAAVANASAVANAPALGSAARTHVSRDLGVCVGRPVDGVRLALAPIDADGRPADLLLEGEEARGVLGEFIASGAHLKAGYDRLWSTDRAAARDTLDGLLWHRTNDIGHIDAAGRVWLEGRVQHVITTPEGPLGPGGPEAVVDALPHVRRSAAVGVGPAGTQALVMVVEPEPPAAKRLPAHGPAPLGLASAAREAVRAATGRDVAAVLVTSAFPTDIRHNSKIDRSRLARWAAEVLAGGRIRRP